MKQKLTKKQKQELEEIIADTKRKSPEVRRAQAVLMISRSVPTETVILATGLSKSRIFGLYNTYLEHGADALRDKRQGKPKELLTKKQRDAIIQTVQTKKPKDVGFSSDFWTTGILGKLIEQEYDVTYKSKTSLYIVFRKASFTYHKPERRYRQRDGHAIKRWRKNNTSLIQKHFATKDTVILAADEMILSTKTTTQKVWLPQGETVHIETTNSHVQRRQIYGFLNLKTGQEHAFKTLKQNMYTTKDVLTQIRNIYPKQRIVLLWDNAGWHKGSVVKEFIKNDERIEVIHFPTYAPEENPQEHVWKRGRSEVTHNRFIEDIDAATDEFVTFLNNTIFPYTILGISPVS